MTTFGYFLSSEEHTPQDLVRQAVLAEEAGFEALWISDHFHPWNDEQGQSPFVWSVIGAIANATSLPITTAVTCPTVRIHPAIIAQAAATSALLTEGRFRPRRGHRREPERAHPRRPLATGRRPPRDARGGGRGHARALDRQAGHAPRHALHRRERQAVHDPGHAATGVRVGVRPEGRVARGAHRRGLLRDEPGGRAASSSTATRAAPVRPRPASRCAGARTATAA